MGLGKNIVDVILRLVDQLSPGYRKAAQEVKAGSQEMAQGSREAAEASGQAAAATQATGDAAAKAAPKRRRMTEEERAAAAAAREAEKAVRQQAQEETKARREQKQANDELRQGYQQLAVAATAFLLAMGVAINNGIAANNRQVAAFTGLRSIVVGTGKDYNEASKFVKSFTEDGLISQARAAEALKNLLQRGFSLDQAIEMLNRLKDAAAFGRQAHLDMGAAVASATEGLKNENSILVDNAGVTKNVSVMWKEYAKEIGKGVQSLTQAEKRLAEYNGIMKETRHQVGDASKMSEQFAGQQARAAKATEEASAALGRAWASALEKVLPMWTGLMTGVKMAIDKYPALTVAVMALAGGFAVLVAAAGVWVTVTTPAVVAAMSAVAVKAGVMWAAITGPVGLVVAALAAVTAGLYMLASAHDRAARAAIERARAEEQAAREAATAARNKVREIVRQEEDLQSQVTSLAQQAADQRKEIARQEMEDRRAAANAFGELLISALKQKYQEQKSAEEEVFSDQISDLKDHYKERLDEAKKAKDQQTDLLREQLDAEKDAIKQAADERRDALRRQRDEAIEALQLRKETLQDQQRDEMDRTRAHYDALEDAAKRTRDSQLADLRTWADEQERIIRNTHSEQLKLLDAETAAQLDAVQAQIDAIDAQTRAEEKAARQQRRDQRISELEAKALTAETAEERTTLLADAAELRAEAEREALLEARDAEKATLREQMEQIRRHAEERREALREQHAAELEQLRLTTEAKRVLLEEEHRAEIERIRTLEKEVLAALERQQKAALKALDDEKKALEQKLKDDLALVDQDEKAQIDAADRVYKAKKQALDDALAAQEQHTKDMLAEVDRLAEEEKTRIHEKYHGENGLLNEARVYAEALKLVHDQNQQEILALLDQYEPDWMNQGKDFVQRLAEGGWEEKPKVDALGEAIGLVMQAAVEDVIMMGEAANDSAAELADINSQLDQAKQSLAEIQSVRAQAESEAAAAERAAAYLELQRARLEELAETSAEDEAMDAAENLDSGAMDIKDEAEEYFWPQGSRHGGGPVPFSGLYRLLQGEHVLSGPETQKLVSLIQSTPFLPPSGGLIARPGLIRQPPALTTMPSGSGWIKHPGMGIGVGVGDLTVNIHDPVVREEQDLMRLARMISQELLRRFREKGGYGG